LHKDVRAAAIPKSLVGNLLPQEEFDRQRVIFPVFEPGVQEDESQGTGKAISISQPYAVLIFPSFLYCMPNMVFIFFISVEMYRATRGMEVISTAASHQISHTNRIDPNR